LNIYQRATMTKYSLFNLSLDNNPNKPTWEDLCQGFQELLMLSVHDNVYDRDLMHDSLKNLCQLYYAAQEELSEFASSREVFIKHQTGLACSIAIKDIARFMAFLLKDTDTVAYIIPAIDDDEFSREFLSVVEKYMIREGACPSAEYVLSMYMAANPKGWRPSNVLPKL
jgi:hypothetical protein